MADKPPTLPPASEPFPGSRTPGWNDPPTLQYNPLAGPAAATGRPRLNLNKRVAFPLQGMGSTGSAAATKPTAIVQPNQSVMPPPPISLPPSVAPTVNNNHPIAVVHPMPNMNVPPVSARVPPTGAEGNRTLGASVAIPSDAQDFSFRILREQTGLVQESINIRREEIERRLGLIEQLWQSGNLNVVVQQKIYQLSKAIHDKSFKDAMDTYTSLVVNHSNDCSTWAVALRHIVLTLQPVGVEVDLTTTSESNIAAVPAMFVPAMPRATNSSNDATQDTHTYSQGTSTNGSGGHSTVQHI